MEITYYRNVPELQAAAARFASRHGISLEYDPSNPLASIGCELDMLTQSDQSLEKLARGRRLAALWSRIVRRIERA